MRVSRGQSILYTVLLMPTLILVLALAVDVGSLQLQKLRLRYALDLATVTAATAVDRAEYTRTGRLWLDPVVADRIAREYLMRNLAGLPEIAAPGSVAAAADVTVINQTPATDPYSGRPLNRPSVCTRIRVPHQFGLLGWIGLHRSDLVVTSEAEIRT